MTDSQTPEPVDTALEGLALVLYDAPQGYILDHASQLTEELQSDDLSRKRYQKEGVQPLTLESLNLRLISLEYAVSRLLAAYEIRGIPVPDDPELKEILDMVNRERFQ